MIYARQPTEAEYSELKHMTRRAIGRVSQRAHLILLSVQGHSVPELASLFAIAKRLASSGTECPWTDSRIRCARWLTRPMARRVMCLSSLYSASVGCLA